MNDQVLYYAGLLILALAISQMLVFIYHQIKRHRAFDKVHKLEKTFFEDRLLAIANEKKSPDLGEAAWAGWRKFRVSSIVQENSIIKSFYLVAHDGKSLPKFLPGQYLTFRLKIPGISSPLVRCYSLSDSSTESRYYRVSIKHQQAPASEDNVPDGISSSFFHNSLEVGDILDVKAPMGKFFLDMDEKSPIVLLAGGIGITPSLSMLNSLYAESSDREVWLFYGIENKQSQIMQSHIKDLQAQMSKLSLHTFYSKPADDNDCSDENTHRGHITVEQIIKLGVPIAADYYVCGPVAMMESIMQGLEDSGVDAERIHAETFGPSIRSKKSQSIAKNEKKDGQKFAVTFRVSDKQQEWSESTGTLLETAEAADVNIEHGCRSGNCGTCTTAIIEGFVSYLEEPSTTVEKGSCLPCVAVPKTDLVLDA